MLLFIITKFHVGTMPKNVIEDLYDVLQNASLFIKGRTSALYFGILFDCRMFPLHYDENIINIRHKLFSYLPIFFRNCQLYFKKAVFNG